MAILWFFVALASFAQIQGQGIPNTCGIAQIMHSTTYLTQTIKATPFPLEDNGYFATMCDFYDNYLEYIDTASEKCTDRFLDALRIVARVGGYYHRLAGRCPETHKLREDNVNIDRDHVYSVRTEDVNSCGGRLRGDDNCVKNWISGIKASVNTCEVFRSGIVCHRDWHAEQCPERDTSSIIQKAERDLNDALRVLIGLQPGVQACENMTPSN